jgi:hypothetical protein
LPNEESTGLGFSSTSGGGELQPKKKCIRINMLGFDLNYRNMLELLATKCTLLINASNCTNSKFYFEVEKTNLCLNSSKLINFNASRDPTAAINSTHTLTAYLIDQLLKKTEFVFILHKLQFNRHNELTNLRVVNRYFKTVNCSIRGITYSPTRSFPSGKNGGGGGLVLDDNVKLLESFRIECALDPTGRTINQVEVRCDFSNFYVYDDSNVFIYLLETYSKSGLSRYDDQNQQPQPPPRIQCQHVKLNLKHSYVNLILSTEKDTIYKFGAREIDLDWSRDSQVELSSNELILYRTVNKKPGSMDHASKHGKTANKQPGDDLNESKRYFKHYWGNLVNLDTIKVRIFL